MCRAIFFMSAKNQVISSLNFVEGFSFAFHLSPDFPSVHMNFPSPPFGAFSPHLPTCTFGAPFSSAARRCVTHGYFICSPAAATGRVSPNAKPITDTYSISGTFYRIQNLQYRSMRRVISALNLRSILFVSSILQ